MKFLDETIESVKDLEAQWKKLKDESDKIHDQIAAVGRQIQEKTFLGRYFRSIGTGKICHVYGLTPGDYPWLKFMVVAHINGVIVTNESSSVLNGYDEEITKGDFCRIRDEWISDTRKKCEVAG